MKTRNWRLMFVLVVGAGMALASSHARAAKGPRVVEIAVKRFEFAPNEITVKRGETVTLRLTTQDVKHGFFSKALGVDADIAPGKPAEITMTPQAAGRFLVVCDNFCGAGHGDMRMTIVVE